MVIHFNEHDFVTGTIMPYLREHWDKIDRPEPLSAVRDGRLTMDELLSYYDKALAEEQPVDAFILNELLKRYELICNSYDDGYWYKDETVLGISEEDVSVYEQLVSRKSRHKRGSSWHKPLPKSWL